MTDFIFSQKPPAEWASMHIKMAEVDAKNVVQNELVTMYAFIFIYFFILANACA